MDATSFIWLPIVCIDHQLSLGNAQRSERPMQKRGAAKLKNVNR